MYLEVSTSIWKYGAVVALSVTPNTGQGVPDHDLDAVEPALSLALMAALAGVGKLATAVLTFAALKENGGPPLGLSVTGVFRAVSFILHSASETFAPKQVPPLGVLGAPIVKVALAVRFVLVAPTKRLRVVLS